MGSLVEIKKTEIKKNHQKTQKQNQQNNPADLKLLFKRQ